MHVFDFDMFYTDVIYEVIYTIVTIDNYCILCTKTCLSSKTCAKKNNQGLQMQDKQLLQRPALISCERLILKWSFLQENGGLLDDML